jgi:aspartate racemase
MLHIVDAVTFELQRQGVAPPARIGILATTATVASQLYQRRLAASGYQCLTPEDEGQACVLAVIRSIKAQRTADVAGLKSVIAELQRRGCSRIVLGCTELPLVLSSDADSSLLDATHSLALACVRAFGFDVRTK